MSEIKDQPVGVMHTIMVTLQGMIDTHLGKAFIPESLSQEQLEQVIGWALAYIESAGGDSTSVGVVVERSQDWNHEAGQLFNRRANINLFYDDLTQFVRITNPAATYVYRNYVVV